MPAKVSLKVVEGDNLGEEFLYEQRTSCILGRSPDCRPQLIVKQKPHEVSRHHCLLDINPPDIRVRDFGSLNGTQVNGCEIGRRASHLTPEQGAKLTFPERDLKDGDEIRICNTVFRVSIWVPPACYRCGSEIPEHLAAAALLGPGQHECLACRQRKPERAGPSRPAILKCCAKCGRDVSAQIGDHRRGEFVCHECKAEPRAAAQAILDEATAGRGDFQQIDGYTIVREIGTGGFGGVYLARHQRTGRDVALKVMLPEVAAEPSSKDSFLREMRNTRALRHPNVVELFECGASRGIFFCTLEYCDLGSVDRLLKKSGGRLPLPQAADLILQTLRGLEYAHQAVIPEVLLADGRIVAGCGLVHRDIKPANIFLKSQGSRVIAKVGDYGLSKAFDAAGLSGQTRTGTASGTAVYMARQQVLNFRYSQPDVDVWAVAATFYKMLTGAWVRNFREEQDLWHTVLTAAPVPIRERDPSVPAPLAEVIDVALYDRRDLHFQSAAKLRGALEAALQQCGVRI